MEEIANYLNIFFNLFVPGLIIYRILQHKLSFEKIEVSNSVFEIVAIGSINYALYLYAVSLLKNQITTGNLNPIHVNIFFIIATPFILAFIFFKIADSNWFKVNVIDVTPDPWNHMWEAEEDCFIIIKTEKGKKGGYFGPNSRVTKYPLEKSIFIEEEWYITDLDEFICEIPDTSGLYVNFDKIVSVQKFQRRK